MKKTLSILLVLCMVLAAVPMLLVPAMAVEVTPDDVLLSEFKKGSAEFPSKDNGGKPGGNWGLYNLNGTTLKTSTFTNIQPTWWVLGDVSTAGAVGGLFNGSSLEWNPNAAQIANVGADKAAGFGFGYAFTADKDITVDVSFTEDLRKYNGVDIPDLAGWFTVVHYTAAGQATILAQKELTAGLGAVSLPGIEVSGKSGDKVLFLFAHNTAARRVIVAKDFSADIYGAPETMTKISEMAKGTDNYPTAANNGTFADTNWGFYSYDGVTLKANQSWNSGAKMMGSWANRGVFYPEEGLGNLKTAPNAEVDLYGQAAGFGFGYSVDTDKKLLVNVSFEKSNYFKSGVKGMFTIALCKPDGSSTIVEQKEFTGTGAVESITLDAVPVDAKAGDTVLLLLMANEQAQLTIARSFSASIMGPVFTPVASDVNVKEDLGLGMYFDSEVDEGVQARCWGTENPAENPDAVPTILDGVKQEDGTYKFTYNVAAKEMNDKIYIQPFAGIYCGDVVEFSVTQYFENAAALGDAKLNDLIASLKTYGAAAQEYFNYRVTGGATVLAPTYENANSKLAVLTPLTGAAEASISSVSLVLEDQIRFKLLVKKEAGDLAGYQLQVSKTADFETVEETVALEAVDGSYVSATTAGVAAMDYETDFFFRVVDASGNAVSGTLQYSVGAYCARKGVATDSSAALKNLCNAIMDVYAKGVAYNA